MNEKMRQLVRDVQDRRGQTAPGQFRDSMYLEAIFNLIVLFAEELSEKNGSKPRK